LEGIAVIDGIPVFAFTPSALLGIVFLMVITGRLVPRSILRDKQKEADQWRQAYETEREGRVTADAQSSELLEMAKTGEAVFSALFRVQERSQRSGEQDAPQEKE
jgi:hypothetical protein